MALGPSLGWVCSVDEQIVDLSPVLLSLWLGSPH
jgi:hypothetical protein